ncbi:MAG: LytTR family DNA-binding domain-containing protein [Marinilabilia sp.]
MKKILIVEDDPFMQQLVQEIILQHFPESAPSQVASTVAEAYEAIGTHDPDLLLLDIRLPDGTAFDLLRQVEIFDFKVVFMSEYQDYYQQAMHFSAVTFISKPFDLSDLVMAIDKAGNAISDEEENKKIEILLSNTDLPASSQTVVFPDVNTDHAVPLASILYGKAVPGGCIMHFDNEKDIFVPRPLRRYEQMFSNYAFFRCHPLYVVNLRKINNVDGQGGSIHLEGGIEIPLEKRRYEQLKKRFQEAGF